MSCIRRRPFPLWCLLAMALSAAALADVTRLAVFAEGDASDAADLLMARLSTMPEIALVERGEIDRILGEQKLSAVGLATAQLNGIGRLLRADGVIFLAKERVRDQEVLAMRIVAVNPGLVIASWRGAAPVEMENWSSENAARIVPLLPKLSVKAEAAVLVSVLNLRVTRARPEAAEIERELTLLLTHRLAHEPALFVLERQRMEALESEKTEVSAAPFWTGRWLIDGAIEQAPADPDALTVSVHLHAPDGGGSTTVRHVCRRDELAGAADALAAEIARKLQQEPARAAWKAGVEAGQFWREAQWAFGNELFATAAIAAESAWVLGQRSRDVITLRVRAELLAARPELVVPYRFPKQYLSNFFQERNFQWRAQLPHTHGYRTPDVLAKIFADMPEAERESRLARTQRALELFRDHAGDLLAEASQTPVAAETLTLAGAMLEWFHDNQIPWSDGMRRVAALLREVDDLATRRVHDFDQRIGHRPPPLFWQGKVALTPLWAADATQTVATYRAALREPFDAGMGATLRITMVHSRDLFPDLTAAGDHTQAAKLWAEFVNELLASDFPGDRWTGLFFQHADASESEREAIAVKSRDAFWAGRERFARHELPFTYFALLRLPRGGHAEGAQPGFETKFLLYLLRESTPIDRDAFEELFHPDTCAKGEAAEIHDAILAHDARVRAKLRDHWVLDVVRERSQELLLRFPELRRAVRDGDALKVTRYWHPFRLPQFRDGPLKRADLSFKEAIYAEQRLWVFATFADPKLAPGTEPPRFIFGIDLNSFATETIAFEPPPPLAAARKDHWGGTNLQISPEAIFVSKDWQLSRYDRRAKTWRHYTGLPGVWEQPWRIGDRLFVQINNAPQGTQVQHFGELAQLDLRTDAVTLLASDRRTPAESPLDAWPLSWLTARAGPEGKVFFRGIGGDGSAKRRYATYDPAAKTWEALDEAGWKSARGTQPAYMAMASEETEWKVEPRGQGRDLLSLKSGRRTVPFQCEFTAEDRAGLAVNGNDPPLEVIESNIMADHGLPPLGCDTPDGVAICQHFRMPGFWFVPKIELTKSP